MKKKAFFLPLLAAFALASCSSDEILDNAGGNQPGKFVGDVAYMTVNIQDVNSLTKATTTGDPLNPDKETGDLGYADGTEHKVNDARFFFFDKDGIFVTEASVWQDGKVDENTKDHIEYIGKNVIVLENLTEKGLPSYLLTVLNAPKFTPESTLEATAKSLELQCRNDIDSNKKGYFVMSTSSYFGTNNHDNFIGDKNAPKEPRYYATKVNESDFKLEPYNSSAIDLGVTIYVERLAAKVELATDMEPAEEAEEEDLYKVKATVAGNGNSQGEDYEGTTELYVRFLGWGLNATAKQTYLSKQLKKEWNEANALWGTSWNVADHYRSFWAESYIYGKDPLEGDALLNYVTYSSLAEGLGSAHVEYCNENTNEPSKIMKGDLMNPAKTTSVLVKAEICDSLGNGLDLVRYNGLLYKKDQFLQYVLNTIDLGAGNLNVYKYTKVKNTEMNGDGTGTETTKMDWIQVGPADVKLSQKGVDGSNKVRVVSNLKNATESGIEGLKYGYKDKDGEMQDFGNVEAAETALDKLLSEKKLIGEAFTGGAMYYNIPIEHLAAQSILNKTNKDEGYYGVVRNHWYKLTIGSLANVGHGVFIPEEGSDEEERPIIPEPEDPRYYLGAQINILSWKVVNQNVGL